MMKEKKLNDQIKAANSQGYNERIKDSFKSNLIKSWNQNWDTIRLLIIFSILIFGFVFIYSQIDSILEILTKSSSK